MFAPFATSVPVSLRRVGGIALAVSALALSACGGGGDRVKDYKPSSVVAFGDDNSAFTTATLGSGTIQGLTYSVNPVTTFSDTLAYCEEGDASAPCSSSLTGVTGFVATAGSAPTYLYQDSANVAPRFNVVTRVDLGTGTHNSTSGVAMKRSANQYFDCDGDLRNNATSEELTWVQKVAAYFGKGFQEACSGAASGAYSYAALGATAADLSGQIAQAKSAGRLGEGVLVTLWIGQNDLYEVFDSSSSNKVVDIQARAKLVAAGVKEIMATKAKVVLVGAPNLAYSPYALAQGSQSCDGDNDRPCNREMETLVEAFNKEIFASLGQDYALDGRNLGYVDAAERVNAYARYSSYQNKAACEVDVTVEPLLCNSANLKKDSEVSSFLWADAKHIGPILHAEIGSMALTRATEQF